MICLTPTIAGPTLLDLDELDLVCELLDIDQLPVVLAAGGLYDNDSQRFTALTQARARLLDRNILDGNEVDSTLAYRMKVLARPHKEIAFRWCTPEYTTRVTAVLDSRENLIVATRHNNRVLIQSSPNGLATLIMGIIGFSAPVSFGGINATAKELGVAFDHPTEAQRTTGMLQQLGASPTDAMTVASAMTRTVSTGEIVALRHQNGSTTAAPGAVAIFDTEVGRIIATPSVSADGTLWSTFAPGTEQRLQRALHTLSGVLDEHLTQGF
ncbi:MAG: ESX secretion-associated protein EspG [Mycobacteriaceae bacterium]